jgi:hypothetical protein
MERANTTSSTDEQYTSKFYLPGAEGSSIPSRVEEFLTTLFRSRDELRTLVLSQRR